jgi:drug/metabolite transporter (DMT)-like permease
VLSRGLVLGVLAAVLVSLPSSITGNLGNIASNVATVAGTVAGQVGSTISEKIAQAQTTPGLQRASFDLPPLSAYAAAFESQAPYPTAHPNGTVEWTVALRNTGSVGWYRGIDGAQASLVLADGTTAGVQTTPFVGPGQVGWFVVHFPAPSTAGTTRVHLLPRIDGRGSLPDLGIYATVTVSPNP